MRFMSGHVLIALVLGALMVSSPARAFSFTFDWAGLSPCYDGHPDRVSNPVFKITGLPAGTKSIRFMMADLNYPDYDHGGGVATADKSGRVAAGQFQYFSPCPNRGSRHSYEWTATAMSGPNGTGTAVGVAKAKLRYP